MRMHTDGLPDEPDAAASDTGRFGTHANAEPEYRIVKRIGLRLGATACIILKGLERLEDAIHITQMPRGNCGFENVNFGGINYTFGLNIDL